MGLNPLAERGIPLERQVRHWSDLNVTPYNPRDVDPGTRARILTMQGIETDAIGCSHQVARQTDHLPTKHLLAMLRGIEQQQQKAVNWLIPGDEGQLELTIGHEQAAVDLTACLARQEPDPYLKQAFDFSLVEHVDQLYRFANLYQLLTGGSAAAITGDRTEVMPGRPTVDAHRHPHDNVRAHYDAHTVDPRSRLHVMTVLAGEQQILAFYMTLGNRFVEPLARGLYLEIAQIQEQHVTQGESLLDPLESPLQQELFRHYNECYLYWSWFQQESDPRIKALWDLHLHMEIEHVRLAGHLLLETEGLDPAEILPSELPAAIRIEPDKAYVRDCLATQLDLTAAGTQFVRAQALPLNAPSRVYQRLVNSGGLIPSDEVIRALVAKQGHDYRHETEGPHPIPFLRKAA